MAHYLLSVYTPADGTPPSPEELEVIMKRVDDFLQELREAGAWVFSGGLEAPDTATVVRLQGSEVLMTDGPFAEVKEYLGGLTIVAAPDLDAALEWGRKAARPYSSRKTRATSAWSSTVTPSGTAGPRSADRSPGPTSGPTRARRRGRARRRC